MTPEELLQQIENDRTRGATELALAAVAGIRAIAGDYTGPDGRQLSDSIRSLLQQLEQCRPSMSALQNLMLRTHDCVQELGTENVAELKTGIAHCCEQVAQFARDAQLAAVNNMLAKIAPRDVIMTHSTSSTIKYLATKLKEEKPGVSFIATESRPGDEGKLLAGFLAELGLRTTYITEAQIDLAMADASKVVIGADAVLADGSVLNKSGSTLIALSARHHKVPFYVCAESFKQKTNDAYELEQMDPAELQFKAMGVEVKNVYFERVPAELITEWIR